MLIEDEPLLLRQLTRSLEREGHEVRCAQSCAEARETAGDDLPDLVLVDIRLPDGSGLDLVAEFSGRAPELPIIVMTAHGSVENAVEAMRRGAVDYLQKPLQLAEMSLLIARLLEGQRQQRELQYLRGRDDTHPEAVVGRDPRVVAILEQTDRLAAVGLPLASRPAILLVGETGTGKGVLARAIHGILGGGPFIELNCTAMPATLVESELFGHERGSFTGAHRTRPGLLEAADGGTLFLDEIGDLSLEAQAKFLKVVEEKRVRRLGSTRDRSVNVQVIAATHHDLDRAVREERFRSDLLHRLRVLSFEIPPLRERREDVRLLLEHFCRELGRLYHGRPIKLSAEAESRLVASPWPGNVRELRNVIERAILLSGGEELRAECCPGITASEATETEPSGEMPLPEQGLHLEHVERGWIRQALERTEGNQTQAAKLLGLTRYALRYRMEKHGLATGCGTGSREAREQDECGGPE